LLSLRFAANYFMDTEFNQTKQRMDFISIGMTSDGNRDFYAVSSEFDPAQASPWVQKNILPRLGEKAPRLSKAEIARGIVRYIGRDPDPHLFTKGGGKVDWLMFCDLFGGEAHLPANMPKKFHDIEDTWHKLGSPKLPPHPGNQHNALADAHWAKRIWHFLNDLKQHKAA
jgi:hypothetical protein